MTTTSPQSNQSNISNLNLTNTVTNSAVINVQKSGLLGDQPEACTLNSLPNIVPEIYNQANVNTPNVRPIVYNLPPQCIHENNSNNFYCPMSIGPITQPINNMPLIPTHNGLLGDSPVIQRNTHTIMNPMTNENKNIQQMMLVGSPSNGLLAPKQQRITSREADSLKQQMSPIVSSSNLNKGSIPVNINAINILPNSDAKNGSHAHSAGLLGFSPLHSNSTQSNLRVGSTPKRIQQTTNHQLILQQSENFSRFLSTSFLDEYNIQPNENDTILLDGVIVYRNSNNMLSQLRVSLSLLSIFSDKFKNFISVFRKNLKTSLALKNGNILSNVPVIGLPVELNPNTIENVLGYIHGNDIVLDFKVPVLGSGENDLLNEESSSTELNKSSDSLGHLRKLYITSKYFNAENLMKNIVESSKKKQKDDNSDLDFDFEQMSKFCCSLPEPTFFENLPFSICELPSLAAVPSKIKMSTSKSIKRLHSSKTALLEGEEPVYI